MKFNRNRNQRATTVRNIFQHINTGTDSCCIGRRPKKSLVQPLTWGWKMGARIFRLFIFNKLAEQILVFLYETT
jgi:hypothetical protein